MAEQLLDRIHAQVRARVRELEAGRARVRAARGGDRSARRPGGGGPDCARFRAGRRCSVTAWPCGLGTPRPGSGEACAAWRQPRRGTGVLAERPGVSASESSSAAGVARPVLYALLKTLEERGEVAKEQLPGGSTGDRVASASGEPSSDWNGANQR